MKDEDAARLANIIASVALCAVIDEYPQIAEAPLVNLAMAAIQGALSDLEMHAAMAVAAVKAEELGAKARAKQSKGMS